MSACADKERVSARADTQPQAPERRIYSLALHSPGIHALVIALGVCLLAALGLLTARPATPSGTVLGTYGTDLAGRTPHQRYNARRAAAAIDGAVIAPGQTFSFSRTVRGWSADRGFLKAPVSYDGVLVDDYGGGVCQCSTTLYNAALLAGLPILERHPHTFAPGYAPPGRDAAVAYSGVDLRFRNPYPWPLTVRAAGEGLMLVCRIEGRGQENHVVLRSRALDWFAPSPALMRPGAGVARSRWHLTGRDGMRVAIYRDFYAGAQRVRHEAISDDTYRPISRAEWTTQTGVR
ncbi:MAG: VanW family protein [Armatimonadetes bacterium]|nr:VanW family protein [Armatimonadota bacterium]